MVKGSAQREVLVGKDRVGMSIIAPGTSFELDKLFSDQGVDHLYFRTESGNVYMLDRNGNISSKESSARGWGAMHADPQSLSGMSIYIGERFECKEVRTTPVTEIVYVSSRKPTGEDVARLRKDGDTSDIVSDYERRAGSLRREHEPDVPKEIGNSGLALALDEISKHMPKEKIDEARKRAKAIIIEYSGQDMYAASVLVYAAERGKFDEYARRMEKNFEDDFSYVSPEARGKPGIPGADRTNKFMIGLFKEMGIKPIDNKDNVIEEKESPKVEELAPLPVGEIEVDADNEGFQIQLDGKTGVVVKPNGDKIRFVVHMPPCMISWYDNRMGMSVQPMLLEGEGHRAVPLDLGEDTSEEPDFRQANRLAAASFAVAKMLEALKEASRRSTVDKVFMEYATHKLDEYSAKQFAEIKKLQRRFEIDAGFRDVMRVLGGGINNMIILEL